MELDRLREHCRARPGMTTYQTDEFRLLDGSLDIFARLIPESTPPVTLLRVEGARRKELAKKYPGVRKSDRMKWKTDGWTWTDVPIDGSLPEETVIELIDHSYQLLLDQLGDETKYRLDLIGRNPAPRDLLRELIEHYALGDHRKAIEATARPALFLRTSPTDEDELPLGRSKIGGRPDLPIGVEWPRHSSGKPLAFLAQVDLAEIATSARLPGLPDVGLLHVFSVHGWQDEGDADPHLPDGEPADDWTRFLYTKAPGELARHEIPDEVNAFPAAAVRFEPIVSIPGDSEEPAWVAMELDSDESDRLETLTEAFEQVTRYPLGDPPRHQLLGYAAFEQGFPEDVVGPGQVLLFQLATDDNTRMCWGDGGYLYFWAKPAKIKRGDFSAVLTDYQCG